MRTAPMCVSGPPSFWRWARAPRCGPPGGALDLPGIPRSVSAAGCVAIRPKAAPGCSSARGAGVSPPPFPQPASAVHAALQHLVGQRPEHFGLTPPRSRWWLGGIRQTLDWLQPRCLATVWQTLRRCHLSYKRGRRAVHSPDPLYAAKLATIGSARQRARRRLPCGSSSSMKTN